jgi:hypothetical protein
MIKLTVYTQVPKEDDITPRELTINPETIMFYYREEAVKKIPIVGSKENVVDYTLMRVQEGVNLYIKETPEEIDALLP